MSPETFEKLLEPAMESAYGYALRLTGNRDDAMDLVQDAAVQAFKGFAGFEAGTNFRAWFFKILTHRFYRIAKQTRNHTVPLDGAEDLMLFEQSVREGGPDLVDRVLDGLDGDAVQEAIDQLPEEFRTVNLLYFLNELKYDEIAQALELPMGTVRSRIHRGRKLLQAALWSVAESRGLVAERGQEVECG